MSIIIHAGIDTGCDKCGSPLLQMIFHCMAQNVEVDTAMVKYFIQRNHDCSRRIFNYEIEGKTIHPTRGIYWTALDLALANTKNGFEVAKVLVEVGKINHIYGENPSEVPVVSMFTEYWSYGTNNYIRWLCNEYLLELQRHEFVSKVLSAINSMKNHHNFIVWEYQRRTPSHAILTCRQKEIVQLLVNLGGEDLLGDKASTGKTALHVAAEENDLESVEVLLQL